MSADKHTPEPLGYGEDNDGWYVEKNGVQIAYGLSEEDARRIVACVNACAGTDTAAPVARLIPISLPDRNMVWARTYEEYSSESSERNPYRCGDETPLYTYPPDAAARTAESKEGQ